MNILLIGGAGYVGSACLRWLSRHGHNPIAYDNLSTGNAASVPSDRLIVADLENDVALHDALTAHEIEAVMHFAALASVPESVLDPQRYYQANVVGTKHVLDAMLSCNVPHFLFSSTAAIYSFDAEMPLHETSPRIPESPYGLTKLAAEQMISDYCRAYDLGAIILRYFNAAGADPSGEHGEFRDKESHLIPLALMTALGQHEELVICGDDYDTPDGTCIRDYIHVDDLAQAHQLAIEAVTPGQIVAFNLGSGKGHSVLEVVRACETVVGNSIPHRIGPRRPGDPPILVASAERIRRELGWEPRYPEIEQIVETAWKWHRTHPQGYREAARAQ